MMRRCLVLIAVLGLLAGCTPPAAETTLALNLGLVQEPPPPPPPPAPAVNTCQIEVGRTEDTQHPHEALQTHVLELNDKFRALLGRDLFVGEDGGRAVIDCTIGAGHAAQATSQGVVLPVYQLTGMPPLNFFLEPRRPGVTGAIGVGGGKAVQLLPFQIPAATETVADFNTVADLLPKPSFSFSPLESALPNPSVAVVPGGTYQINDVLRFEVTPVDPAVSASLSAGAAVNLAQSAIRLRQTVVVGPDGCAWNDCAGRVPNAQDRTRFKGQALAPGAVIDVLFTELQRIIAAKQDAGVPVVAAQVLDEALAVVDWDVAHWLDLRYHVIGTTPTPELTAALSAQLGTMEPAAALGFVGPEFTIPLLVLTPDYIASGGGGCGKAGGGCALRCH